MQTRFLIACALAPLLAACRTVPVAFVDDAANADALFQSSTYAALADGLYDGDLTIGELKRHGDFGHGTFNGLDGEMIVLDGVVYQAQPGGAAGLTAAAVSDNVLTPFAAVTFFEAEEQYLLDGSGEGRAGADSAGRDACATEGAGAADYAALRAQLDALLAQRKGNAAARGETHTTWAQRAYAIRISGTFRALTLRAPRKAEPPYPPLTEALATQVVQELADVRGAMVGFYFPARLAGFQFPGYHFHFVSEDRRIGGHVLEVALGSVQVAVDEIDAIQVDGF